MASDDIASPKTFKYLPPERISFLDDGFLRFTPPGDLNDPFECLPTLSLEETHAALRAVISEREAALQRGYSTRRLRERFRADKKAMLGQLASNPRALRDFFFERAEKSLNANIGILSLSKRWDSSLMWSHYCLSHSGFCVGFHRTHQFFHSAEQNPRACIREVAYSNTRIKVPVERGKLISFDVMFTKSLDWAYEHEERMLNMLAGADLVLHRTPYPIHLFKLPLDSVAEITVGARATPELELSVRAFCSERGIAAYRATPSSSTFDMLRNPLNA